MSTRKRLYFMRNRWQETDEKIQHRRAHAKSTFSVRTFSSHRCRLGKWWLSATGMPMQSRLSSYGL